MHIQQILFSVGGLRQIVVVVHPERLCTAECDVPAVALTVQGKGLTVQAALAKLGVGIQVEDAVADNGTVRLSVEFAQAVSGTLGKENVFGELFLCP